MPTALRRIRRERFLTQAELGDAVGVGQTTISKWESSRTRKPPARLLPALESYLGLDRTVLLALENEQSRHSESDGLASTESAEIGREGTTCNGDHPQDGNPTSEREAHCE